MAKITKKLFRDPDSIAGYGKEGDSKQDRILGRSAKIPIANTFSELVEMDFADYGDFASFLRIQDTFHVAR